MSSLSSFSFTSYSEYNYEITQNVFLHIYRYNRDVAIIQFIDEKGNKINIPKGFIVYIKDYGTKKTLIHRPHSNNYILCWREDYKIEYNGKLLLDITNNRNWDISLSL